MASRERALDKSGHAGGAGMLQAMYEAARKEVFADPAAALRKYEPSWALSLSPSAECRKAPPQR